ncbi:11071_t:CDS:1, partial [Scutellospora calospora]
DVQSKLELHLSIVVKTCYQNIFGTKTEYSGLAAISFENEDIIQELIIDITFFLIFIYIEKLHVVIPSISNLNE